MKIRPLKREDERALVARRMRQTLIEVLGEQRGAAMYTLAWLEARVGEHLGRDDAAVLLAEHSGDILGHTIVRVEEDDRGRFGLFSTTFVVPKARRQGVAGALLAAGEGWMTDRALLRAVTWTAADNGRLIGLYEGRSYQIVERPGEMVRLEKAL